MAVTAVVPSGSAVAATAVVGSAGAVGLGFATCFFGFGSLLALPLVFMLLQPGSRMRPKGKKQPHKLVYKLREMKSQQLRGVQVRKKTTWFEEC